MDNYPIVRLKHLQNSDCVMVGVDMYGGDLEAIPANDFHECRQKCNETNHCKRWTYQASKEGACFLKDEDAIDAEDAKNYDEFMRSDERCGNSYPLNDGAPAWCNPNGEAYCCSEWGYCGNSEGHCNCEKCVDYRNKTASTGLILITLLE